MKIISILALLIIALFIIDNSTAQTQGKKEKTPSRLFGSFTYRDGDIIMQFFDDSSFVLEIKKWDGQLLTHTAIDTLEGKLEINSNDTLVLNCINGTKVTYISEDYNLEIMGKKYTCDSWKWVSSSWPLNLDSVDLVDKEKTDRIFLDTFKNQIEQMDSTK